MKSIDNTHTMTERYEHLRATRRMQFQPTREVALMIESGMPCWLNAWATQGIDGAASTVSGQNDKQGISTPLTGDTHSEAIGIFTAMVWDIVKEDVHVYDN